PGTLVAKGQPAGVTATQSPAGTGPGTYTITFTAAKDFVLSGSSTQQVTVLAQLTGAACDNGTVPVPQPGAGEPPVVAAQPPVTEQPPAVVGGVEQSKPPKAAGPKPAQAPAAGPKAAPAPAIAGVQATGPAVPTAVNAGLGSLPTAGQASDDLGRTLTAGGLAMLVAAGWLAMGRRETKGVKA
ncbi:MAG TPA: hypothetical protein VFH10_06175, partial [Nocardioides sp.]|nr:hypothetical protein [Nocardioides sp.]